MGLFDNVIEEAVKAGVLGAKISVDQFIHLNRSGQIEDAFDNYWDTLNNAKLINEKPNPPFPMQLIYAYLVENTRIIQIMERVMDLYTKGEALGILKINSVVWVRNTEEVFYKGHKSFSLNSALRPNMESVRRNAYYRLFGIDLTHGDPATPVNPNYNYFKSEIANVQFVPVFEKLMTEVWQAQINASNTSGVNTTDIIAIEHLIVQLQDMLLMRRCENREDFFNNYRDTTLAKEEFNSVLLAYWFFSIINFNSQICQDLQAEAVTPGERLIKIGKKVGLPAHTKSDDMLELAGLMSVFLRMIERDEYRSKPISVQQLLIKTTPVGGDMMRIINLWQRTTGRNLKVVR
jgi:hypothetical protein